MPTKYNSRNMVSKKDVIFSFSEHLKSCFSQDTYEKHGFILKIYVVFEKKAQFNRQE